MSRDVKAMNNDQKMMIAAVFLFIILASSLLAASISLFVIQLFMFFITYPLIIRGDYKSAKVYLWILFISTAWIFLIYYANIMAYGEPYYLGGSDDLFFEETGFIVSKASIFDPRKISLGVLDEYTNAPLFSVYTGLIVTFSEVFDGYNSFIPRILNTYFLIWIAIIFRNLLEKYGSFDKKKSLIAVTVFALTPNVLFINSHIFRDTFNLLQVLLAAYLFGEIFKRKNYQYKIFQLIAFIFVFILMYYTRKNSIAFFGTIVALAILFKNKPKRKIFVLSVLLIIFSNTILEFLNFKHFQEIYSDYLVARSGDGLSRFIFDRELLPFGIVLRSVYALMTPFPNFALLFKENAKILYDFAWSFVMMGTLVQMFFAPYVLMRIKKIDWLTLSFVSWFIPIIVTTFTFRHTMFYHIFLVAMAVDGFSLASKKTRKVISIITIYGFVLLLTMYIILKM